MIIDDSGIELIPGNNGINCPGNGSHYNKFGKLIECCCDECDYLICCTYYNDMEECKKCTDADCTFI